MLLLSLSVSALAQKSRILFVGNSLTYTNNLPELVKNEARKKGFKVQTTMIAYPNYALIDHLDDGEVQKRIRSGKFDYVIVQQGPSSQSEGREMLLDAGRKFQMLCQQNETELVFFMVWPSLTNYHTFEGVIKNHRDAAIENEALLCPVGEAWKDYFERTDDSTLYGLDGFHPSRKGSRLAAEVIVKTLFDNG
ncbi:Lysophospholipase L1 [Ekhidna lutea]|uniref:Lysophospholipase L1 n=2 Tax=Ekhidna lutea TaxID=447679 RepID=A0A239LHK5_EKHLU|nr:Lysophospholipase L1 [Ekhidna lutea]